MPGKPYITCRQLIEFLLDYTSGELPAPQRVEFDRHLAVCPDCVAYVKTYQHTVQLAKAAFEALDEPMSDEVPEALVAAILTASKLPRT